MSRARTRRVNLPEWLHRELVAHAQATGRSPRAHLIAALASYLARNDRGTRTEGDERPEGGHGCPPASS